MSIALFLQMEAMSKKKNSPLKYTTKRLTILTSAFVYALVCNISFLSPTQAADGAQLAAEGLKFFQQKKYPQAFKALSAAEKTRGVDPSLNYYLGVSALYSNNHAVAKRALSRAVVLSPLKNPFHQQSLALLNQYYRVQPYSCRATRSAHWSSKAMPLKIFVSDGKMLPAAYQKDSISAEEVSQIGKWAKNPAFVSRLETVPNYKSEYKRAVMSGVQRWNWAASEGFLSTQFVQDPSKADVLVFFYERGRGGGFTRSNGTPNEANVMQLQIPDLSRTSEERAAGFTQGLEWVATHEFGHVCGLDHSLNGSDIMYDGMGGTAAANAGTPSMNPTENDKQTLRALYAGPAELIRTSVAK